MAKFIEIRPVYESVGGGYLERGWSVLFNLDNVTYVEEYYDSETNTYPRIYINFIGGGSYLVKLTIDEFKKLLGGDICLP